MKSLRWSSRSKKNDEKQKTSSGSSTSASSSSGNVAHRGSTTSNSSTSSSSKPGSLPKSVSNFYLSDVNSRSQRSLSSSSSRHDLKTVTDEESLDSISAQSPTLTPIKSLNKEIVPIGGSSVQLNSDTFDSMIFKTGWINKSHGSSSSPSTSNSSSSSSNHSSRNRESRIYGSESSSNSSSNNFSSYTQEYRLYKGQLKGCVLNLYKSGIANAKYFDPCLDPPPVSKHEVDEDHHLHMHGQPGASDISSALSSSTLTKNNNSSTSTLGSTKLKANTSARNTQLDSTAIAQAKEITQISFLSDNIPHPNLKIDKHGQIIYGTVESICHAVLFFPNSDSKKILDLILMLPLVEDFNLFLQVFHLYGINFTKNNEKLTKNAKQYFKVSPSIDKSMTQRLALVVKTVLDIFPGFLLDEKSFHYIIQLLDTISLHDDEISNTLKLPVAESHNRLSKLIAFSKVPIDQKVLYQFTDVKEFLKIDNTILADQIHKINLKFNRLWSPQSDYSLLFHSQFNKDYVNYNPLVFNNTENVHYVSRLLIEHLFKTIGEYPLHPKERAVVLTKWVQLGCTFEKIGDMVSWLAIATIICSIPVLRLSSTWQYISDQTLKVIFKDWVPTIVQLDRRQLSYRATNSVFILAPPNLNESSIRENVIPYFGDLTINTNDLTQETMFRYLEKKIYRTKNAFHKWQLRLDDDMAATNKKDFDFDDSNIPFYHFMSYHVSQSKLNIEKLMEMSLVLEPPTIDKFDNSTGLLKRSPLLSGSYLPILFNELFPAYSLFPQSTLIGAAGVQQNRNSYIQSNTLTRSGKTLSVSGPIDLLKPDDKSSITGIGQIDLPTVKELSSKQSNKQMLLRSIRDVFSINMDIFHVLDDLSFKSLDETDRKSRPTSVVIETPKRFSIQSPRDSQEIMNRLSVGVENMDFFKNIARNTDSWDEIIINVVLKAGSLDKLFDVLVLTSSVFSRLVNINDISLYFKNQQGKSNESIGVGLLDYAMVKLTMDNDLYTKTFFNTYKSFTSTVSVLENLAKRFIGAKSCAVSIERLVKQEETRKKHNDTISNIKSKFPSWDLPESEFNNDHYIHCAKIQIGTAEALFYLIKEHYSDFNDDLRNNKLLLDIIKIMDQEIIDKWETRVSSLKAVSDNIDDQKSMVPELEAYHSKLKELLQKIKSSYQRQLYRPVGVNKNNRTMMKVLHGFNTITMDRLNDMVLENPTDDTLISSFQDLKSDSYQNMLSWVNKLDSFFLNHLKLASLKDWMTFSQIVEGYSNESLDSLFHYPQLESRYHLISSGTAQLEDLEILNIFKWLTSLTKNNLHEEAFFKKIPSSIQLIINLHIALTNFFIAQIAQLEKTYQARLETCCIILHILGFARWKNSSIDLFQASSDSDSTMSPHVPSFIESAIVNALLSPESRRFEMSWKHASEKITGKANLKSIGNILDLMEPSIKKFVEFDGIISQRKNLCPCPGWFIGRLLEISQLVPNMSIENSKLINFDKRRFTFNLVSNFQELLSTETDFENIHDLNFGSVLCHYEIDPNNSFRLRSKDVAISETKSMKYQICGLFNEVLISEMYKIKREKKKKDHLMSQEKEFRRSHNLQQVMKQKSIDMQTSLLSQVQQQSANPSSSPRYKRSSVVNNSRNSVVSSSSNNNTGVGRKIGGFFKRPFSISGFSTSVSSTGINSILVNSVQQNGSIAPVDLPKINPEDLTDQKPLVSIKSFEIKKCINVNNFSNDNSMIHCFKIVMENGQEHLIQSLDNDDLNQWLKAIALSKRYSFHSKKFKGKTSNKVFGVPIEDICEREGTLTPTIVHKLLEEIELRGLDEIGLYRVPGSVGSINSLKNAFDDEGAVNNSFTLEDDRWFEINTIAGCFKLYLRELPESPFTNEKLPEFIELMNSLQSNALEIEEFENLMIEKLTTIPIYNYHMMKRIFQHLNKVHNHMESNRMDANNLAIVFSMSFINQDDLANSMGPSLGLLQTLIQHFIRSPDVYFCYD